MYDNFSKVSDVLQESVLKSKRFGQAFDMCMFFNFWGKIAGKKFEKISIPYDLKGGVLLVSVKNATVAQELSFFKADLIKNSEPYAKGLNLKIFDIKFNYKNWLAVEKGNESEAFEQDFYEYFTEEDFNKISLTEDEEAEFKKLKETVEGAEFLPKDTREKLYNNILKQFKAQKLRKLNEN